MGDFQDYGWKNKWYKWLDSLGHRDLASEAQLNSSCFISYAPGDKMHNSHYFFPLFL